MIIYTLLVNLGMTTLTVEIDKDRDLPVLQALLNRMGLKFNLEDSEWGDVTEAEIEGIKAGLEDLEAGRLHTHADVISKIDQKLELRLDLVI
jgi:hypothetical protein